MVKFFYFLMLGLNPKYLDAHRHTVLIYFFLFNSS